MSGILHVLIQYCNARRQDRQAEYDECLRQNLANSYVKAVHNLAETQVTVPEHFRTHPKYRETVVGRWLTYRDAIDYANRNLAGEPVALLNLDIFLDPATDWSQVPSILANNIVLCLSRTEWNSDGSTFLDPLFARTAFAQTQDAWVFLPPIDVPNCDFEIGTLGCDNAIAHRFKMTGRLPINKPQNLRIFHYDRCRGKSAANQNAVHRAERGQQATGRHPEKEGQLLLPDFDAVKSLDVVADAMKLTPLQRYDAICEMLSRFRQVKN